MARQLGIVYRKGGHVSWPIRRMSLADANATISKGGTLAINKANGHAEVWDKEGRCIGYLTRAQVEKINSSTEKGGAMSTARTGTQDTPARDDVGTDHEAGVGPYHWTRWWRGSHTERPRVNHKPNSFAKLATARKHVADFIRSYQTYGDRGEVLVTIRDCNGRIVEKHSVRPNPNHEPIR